MCSLSPELRVALFFSNIKESEHVGHDLKILWDASHDNYYVHHGSRLIGPPPSPVWWIINPLKNTYIMNTMRGWTK